jgi:hypothetical protein
MTKFGTSHVHSVNNALLGEQRPAAQDDLANWGCRAVWHRSLPFYRLRTFSSPYCLENGSEGQPEACQEAFAVLASGHHLPVFPGG